jgi:hypothetical protein
MALPYLMGEGESVILVFNFWSFIYVEIATPSARNDRKKARNDREKPCNDEQKERNDNKGGC